MLSSHLNIWVFQSVRGSLDWRYVVLSIPTITRTMCLYKDIKGPNIKEGKGARIGSKDATTFRSWKNIESYREIAK